MTITATIKFKSQIPIKQVFRAAQEAVATPDIENVEWAATQADTFIQFRNPVCIGAKALTWVNRLEKEYYSAYFDIPSCSDTDLSKIAKDFVNRLGINEFLFNVDTDDEWHLNKIV